MSVHWANLLFDELVEVVAVTLTKPVEAGTFENLSLEAFIKLAPLLRSDEHIDALDRG